MAGLLRRLVVLALLLALGRSGSCSSHSLHYFYTVVSESGPGLPLFNILGYVDDQPFNKYDGITRKDVPIAAWMKEFGKADPQYWERNTQDARITESWFIGYLATLQNRNSRKNSTGLHTLQWMYGCEMGLDGQPRGGYYQYAYDGEDFVALDVKTVTWTASDPLALKLKRKWEANDWAQRTKFYLEKTCVESLQEYLVYRNKTLQRTEAPTVKVARKAGYDGRETLICRAHGFYPKEIEVSWKKDGEDRKPETFTGGVVPNSDGTYHTWLSIEVDSKDRDHYSCQVEHDGLPEHLNLALDPETRNGTKGLYIAVAVQRIGQAVAVWQRDKGEAQMSSVPVDQRERNMADPVSCLGTRFSPGSPRNPSYLRGARLSPGSPRNPPYLRGARLSPGSPRNPSYLRGASSLRHSNNLPLFPHTQPTGGDDAAARPGEQQPETLTRAASQEPSAPAADSQPLSCGRARP